MSTVTWINANGGDFDTASNWDTDTVPSSADDVVITASAITTDVRAGSGNLHRTLSGVSA
jgi:hypothetical protein